MSVREYIGARYVPLFMGEWDNAKSFEPLSVVQYHGNSYTSRQFVPIGIDINNEIYWAETGNYNAQIEQYRQTVLSFDERISDNTTAIESNTENIELLDGKIDTNIELLDGKIDTNVAAINKKFIVDTLYGFIKQRNATDISYLYSNAPTPKWDSIQSCCYTKNGRYAALFSPGMFYYRINNTNYLNKVVIKEYDDNGVEYDTSLPIDGGHGNALCYNPVNDEFLIARNYDLIGNAAEEHVASNAITIVNYSPKQKVRDIYYPELGNTITGISYDADSNTLMIFNGDMWRAAYIDPSTYEIIGDIISLDCFKYIYEGTYNIFNASRRQSQSHNKDYIFMNFYMPNMIAVCDRNNPENGIIKIINDYNLHDGEYESFDVKSDGTILYTVHKRYYNRSSVQEAVSNIFTIYESNIHTNQYNSEWIEGSSVSAQRWIDVNPNTDNIIQNGSPQCPCKTVMEAYWLFNSTESNQPKGIRIQSDATGEIIITRLSGNKYLIEDDSQGHVKWINNVRLTYTEINAYNINVIHSNAADKVPFPYSSVASTRSNCSANMSTVRMQNCTIESVEGVENSDKFVLDQCVFIQTPDDNVNVYQYRNNITAGIS